MTFDGRLLGGVSVLAAIAEAGSFARAATLLQLTPSGVSRAVARLEARVGVRLLERTTRSVSLTDDGRRLYAEVAPLLVGIEDAFTQTQTSADVVSGHLRVNVDAFFSRMMLAPHIGRFLERYPEVSLDLIAREQLGDLVGEGFDVAVRFGTPPSSSLVARKLLETRTVTVAAPAYLKKHGRPATPKDLGEHLCVQVRNTLTGQALEDWKFHRGRSTVTVKTSGRLLVTEVGTLLRVCLDGVGIARLKAIGIQDLIDGGQLLDLFPSWPGERFPLYALYPSRHLPAAKVRAFIEFVAGMVGRPPREMPQAKPNASSALKAQQPRRLLPSSSSLETKARSLGR
jgi:DNA-binding transcriptional LysR family regulator